MKGQILLCIYMIILFSCSVNRDDKGINVETNKNVETLAICFEIADKGFWKIPFNDYQPMKYLARKRFEQFRDQNVIQIIDTLVNKGFWLDAMVEVLLKSSPLPNAELKYELEKSTISRLSNNKEEATRLINEFLISLNKFYIDARLPDYFTENKNYFDSVNNEVRKNLPNKHFITTMESYYGKQNDSYTLIPVPTLWHTAGLGLRIKGTSGFKVYNIFGPLIVTKDSLDFGYGYNNPDKINELTVHEFGHSFINPVTELPENRTLIDKYNYLFKPIKDKMAKQGYNNWWTCVTEHLVRLGEIRISYALGDSSRADRIRNDYINNHSFIYLTHLEKVIIDYEKNRKEFKSINAYIPILLKSFGQIDTLNYKN